MPFFKMASVIPLTPRDLSVFVMFQLLIQGASALHKETCL